MSQNFGISSPAVPLLYGLPGLLGLLLNMSSNGQHFSNPFSSKSDKSTSDQQQQAATQIYLQNAMGSPMNYGGQDSFPNPFSVRMTRPDPTMSLL